MTNTQQALVDYILHLADNSMVLAQQNAAWCGHGPILEQDIAITNITLDILGQARNFYQYAALILNEHGDTNTTVTEDSLAFLRSEREYKNILLCEQPNGDWAQTIVRQFLYTIYIHLIYEKLTTSSDAQLAAIAEKSLKEIKYHITWCKEWMLRLGDGTDESHHRMEKAIKTLWPYTGECFLPAPYEVIMFQENIAPDTAALYNRWKNMVYPILEEATLSLPPEDVFMQQGGKIGVHSEKLGFILPEMQHLQRSYPGVDW